MDHLHTLVAWCGALPGGPALLLALFVAGLAGSVAHCAPMCGPFVLGQVADRLARAPAARLCEMTRLRGTLLLPYHAGRLTTYAALGGASAAIGGVVAQGRWLPAALLAAAGAICAGHAARRAWPASRWASWPGFIARRAAGGMPGRVRLDRVGPGRVVARLARRVDRTRATGGFMLGALLGFLPCGMVYAALALAGASGSPALGAAAMLAFGAGTVPTLVGVGLAGHAARRLPAPGLGRALASAILLANAGLLWLIAGRLLAS